MGDNALYYNVVKSNWSWGYATRSLLHFMYYWISSIWMIPGETEFILKATATEI